MLFADEIFDLCMMLVIKDYSSSEPTGLELTTRYAYWTIAVVAIIAIYVIGLTLH